VFAGHWTEVFWYLLLFELYALAGKHDEGLDEAVNVGAGGVIGENWTRRGEQVGAKLDGEFD